MPAKTRFSVALDEGEYAELLDLADKHRISMVWLVRRVVADFLERCRREELRLPLRLSSAPPDRGGA